MSNAHAADSDGQRDDLRSAVTCRPTVSDEGDTDAFWTLYELLDATRESMAADMAPCWSRRPGQNLGVTCEAVTLGHNPAPMSLTQNDIVLPTNRIMVHLRKNSVKKYMLVMQSR